MFYFAGHDVCFVGVPFDQGTSNRPGARFGPRQVRQESHLVRAFNKETGKKQSEQLLEGCHINIDVKLHYGLLIS